MYLLPPQSFKDDKVTLRRAGDTRIHVVVDESLISYAPFYRIPNSWSEYAAPTIDD